MPQAMTATTSQDALNALLCQAMPPQGYWSDEQYRNQDRFWLGADVVVEVVSPDDPGRDLVVKRADYAEAAIPEYWIVDPRVETVTVLTLAGGAYVEHGVFSPRGGGDLAAVGRADHRRDGDGRLRQGIAVRSIGTETRPRWWRSRCGASGSRAADAV